MPGDSRCQRGIGDECLLVRGQLSCVFFLQAGLLPFSQGSDSELREKPVTLEWGHQVHVPALDRL